MHFIHLYKMLKTYMLVLFCCIHDVTCKSNIVKMYCIVNKIYFCLSELTFNHPLGEQIVCLGYLWILASHKTKTQILISSHGGRYVIV